MMTNNSLQIRLFFCLTLFVTGCFGRKEETVSSKVTLPFPLVKELNQLPDSPEGGILIPPHALGAIEVNDWSFKGDKHKGKVHVGYVVGKQGKNIVLLGGNQGNQVKLSAYQEKVFNPFVVPTGFSGEVIDLPAFSNTFKAENFAGTR